MTATILLNGMPTKKTAIRKNTASPLLKPNPLQFFDGEHSSHSEDRFLMLGMNFNQRLLLVCHCVRKQHTIRIISARKAAKTESSFYSR